MLGRIFDIEEFAVYDGPGIRTVVFLKGCPLRCMWCHNPEGLDAHPSRITQVRLCGHCGACDAVCPSPKVCTGCGECAKACPKGLIQIAGAPVDADEIARRVLKNKDLLLMNSGGVTFSGGEPLLQSDFMLEIRKKLSCLHAAVETSGYADESTFSRVIENMDYVIMDLKLIDESEHIRYTGVSNKKILKNLEILKSSSVPFRIRIPVIPGVNDTDENFLKTAALLEGANQLDKVELLPYHKTAGAKYESVRKNYAPRFDPDRTPHMNTDIFQSHGMEVSIL